MPLVPPYLALKKGIKAENGVNFAIAGATAIAAEYFYSKNIKILWTNISLTHQLGWFQEVKSNICATRKGMVVKNNLIYHGLFTFFVLFYVTIFFDM